MKLILTTAAILAATTFAAGAAETYVDKNGCTRTPILGASGAVLYWNLGLEPGCGRINKDGGIAVELARQKDRDTDK